MFNISFLQIVIVLGCIFLMFGDFSKLGTNFKLFKTYFVRKNKPQPLSPTSQEKRESNP
jgi:hypothetical protein